MQKHPGKKLHYFIINLLILSMIGGIYFFSTNQDAQNVIARLTANPISSGNSYEDEIFFLGSYQGDPQTLTDILDAAEKNQVQLTVFTTPQWMEEHADLAKRIANRHCLGIYGEDYQGNWEEAAIREDLRKSCLVYQEIVGEPAKYYMPFHAEYDKQLNPTIRPHLFLLANSLCAARQQFLLCCFHLGTYRRSAERPKPHFLR